LGPKASADYYFDLVKRKIAGNPQEEILSAKVARNGLRQFQADFSRQVTREQNYELEALREFSYLKEARKERQIYRMNYVMDGWYREVGRRLAISPLQARYVTLEEYKAALIKGKEVDVDIINERYNLSASWLCDGKLQLVTGSEANKLKKTLLPSDNSAAVQVSELKGAVAYPGKVRGVVKIVNAVKDMEKFKEGDILVSYSTNPSLVPAMNKAAAIVTNTGGVTCHAAIVSRELRTPCVIGTGFATKVLRDGDVVEVDARKGIVKILKNSNEK
jgi:phosphoenolpyruvate synthase/pyruvate phosphate dikinase